MYHAVITLMFALHCRLDQSIANVAWDSLLLEERWTSNSPVANQSPSNKAGYMMYIDYQQGRR